MFLIKSELTLIAFVFFVAGLAVSSNYHVVYALPFWVVTVLMVVFFRHPKRFPPLNAWSIVSPVDGYVKEIIPVTDPFLNKESVLIRLVRKHMGVMSLYSPMQGQLVQAWYGENYQRLENQNCEDMGHVYTGWIQNKQDDDVLLSFYRSKTLRYLEVRAQPGERVGQGREIGISSMKYIDIYVPKNTKLNIDLGDKLFAGHTVIGDLVHKKKLVSD